MIAVIFEFTPAQGRFPEYMDLVGTLKADLEKTSGIAKRRRGAASASSSRTVCASPGCCATTPWTIACRRLRIQ